MGRSKKNRSTGQPPRYSAGKSKKKEEQQNAYKVVKNAASAPSNPSPPWPATLPPTSTSHLLDLPLELFRQIVHEVVCDVKAKSAWKLRATCRTFASEISRDIFATQPKDITQEFWDWDARKSLRCGFDQYLFNRSKNPLDIEPFLPRKIKYMAEYLFEELDIHGRSNRDALLMKLCQGFVAIFGPAFKLRASQETWNDFAQKPLTTLDKLAAAISIRSYDLVASLLTQIPARGDGIAWFNCFAVAAFLNDTSLFKTIVQYLETLELKKRANRTLGDQYLLNRDSFLFMHTAISFSVGVQGKNINVEMIQALLDFHRVYLRLPDNEEYSGWLKSSIRGRRPHVLEAILRMAHRKTWTGANVLLKEACTTNDRRFVDVILDNVEIDLEQKSINTSPIFVAVRSNSVSCMTAIFERSPKAIEIKALSNHRTTFLAGKKFTPLALAGHEENPEIIRCLLENDSPIPDLDTWPFRKSPYQRFRGLIIDSRGQETKIPSWEEFVDMGFDGRKSWKFT